MSPHCLFIYATGSCLPSFSVPRCTQPSLDALCTGPITHHRKYHRYRLSFQSQFFFLGRQYIICPEELKHWLFLFFTSVLLRILSLENNVKINPIPVIVLTISTVKHLSANNTQNDMLNLKNYLNTLVTS